MCLSFSTLHLVYSSLLRACFRDSHTHVGFCQSFLAVREKGGNVRRENHHNEADGGDSKLQQVVRPEVVEDPRPLRPVQPLPTHHAAVHRLRKVRHRGGELQFPQEGAACQIVKHYEGNQPATTKPLRNALRPNTAGCKLGKKKTISDSNTSISGLVQSKLPRPDSIRAKRSQQRNFVAFLSNTQIHAG